jgi:hypothetical protein
MLIESFVSGSVAQAIRVHDGPEAESGKPMTFRASAEKFFAGEYYQFLKEGRTLSAALVAVRLIMWIGVVVFALLHAIGFGGT